MKRRDFLTMLGLGAVATVVGAKAHQPKGGAVKPRPYSIGERGPEIFHPGKKGRVQTRWEYEMRRNK